MATPKQQIEGCLQADGNIDFLDFADDEAVQMLAKDVESAVDQASSELDAAIQNNTEKLPALLRSIAQSILK